MGKNMYQTRYISVIEVMGKKIAIELPFDYDFWGSGILLPPIIKVHISRDSLKLPPMEGRLYIEAEFVLVNSEREAAKAFNTTQQSISLWIKSGEALLSAQPKEQQGEISRRDEQT